jgi:hypothetical protein
VIVWIDAPGEDELRRRMLARNQAPAEVEARIANDRAVFIKSQLNWQIAIPQADPLSMAIWLQDFVRDNQRCGRIAA